MLLWESLFEEGKFYFLGDENIIFYEEIYKKWFFSTQTKNFIFCATFFVEEGGREGRNQGRKGESEGKEEVFFF